MSSTYPDPGTCLWSPLGDIFSVMIDRVLCMTALKGRHQLQIRNLTIRAHTEDINLWAPNAGGKIRMTAAQLRDLATDDNKQEIC